MYSIKQIPQRYIIWAILYAVIFPVTYMVGGFIGNIGQIISLPFIPGAWMISQGFISIFGRGYSYLIGLAFGTFIQLFVILFLSRKCLILESYKTQVRCVIPKILLLIFVIFLVIVMRIYYLISFH